MPLRKRLKERSKISEKPRAEGEPLKQERVLVNPEGLKQIAKPLFGSSKLSDGARTWQVKQESARLGRQRASRVS